MNYQTFKPHPDLEPLVKCYWTLEIPAGAGSGKQRILPDGCVEMIFILGDDIKSYREGETFVFQPRAMLLGQISKPFFVEPTGYVHSFAVRFYPYGFANFTTIPLHLLSNQETALSALFGNETANDLEHKIKDASSTAQRIQIIEDFLFGKMEEENVVSEILKSTTDTILLTKGSVSINQILKDAPSKRRQLERNFTKHIGLSPKQLCKVIRLQAALKMILNNHSESLSGIAYESQYFDQAHFTNDFKDFTGISPKDFYQEHELVLSALLYAKE